MRRNIQTKTLIFHLFLAAFSNFRSGEAVKIVYDITKGYSSKLFQRTLLWILCFSPTEFLKNWHLSRCAFIYQQPSGQWTQQALTAWNTSRVPGCFSRVTRHFWQRQWIICSSSEAERKTRSDLRRGVYAAGVVWVCVCCRWDEAHKYFD